MKLRLRGSAKRFDSPDKLRGDAPFLGATVEQWDKAIVGNMEQTLAEIKRKAELAPRRDVSTATTFDLASYASRRKAGDK